MLKELQFLLASDRRRDSFVRLMHTQLAVQVVWQYLFRFGDLFVQHSWLVTVKSFILWCSIVSLLCFAKSAIVRAHFKPICLLRGLHWLAVDRDLSAKETSEEVLPPRVREEELQAHLLQFCCISLYHQFLYRGNIHKRKQTEGLLKHRYQRVDHKTRVFKRFPEPYKMVFHKTVWSSEY